MAEPMPQPRAIEKLSDRAAREAGLTSEGILKLVAIAQRAASLGGDQLSHYFGQLNQVREKGISGDLVTEADHAAEAAVLAFLWAETPEFGVLAEESGRHPKASPYEWCIDPLDGTTNYAHGFPFFGTSIGLTWNGLPLLGALAVPALAELFWGAPGQGSWCNGKKLAVSSCNQLGDALLATGFAYDRRSRLDNNYSEFAYFTHRSHGVRRAGAAAVDLAFVAAGRMDGYWERGLSAWDLAAGVVLVEQAGGLVCNYAGGEMVLAEGRLIACGQALQQQIVGGLAACRPLPGSTYGAEELDP